MSTTSPETYNDDRINEYSRAVFMKALKKSVEMIDGKTTINYEAIHAYAELANAAACGFKPDDDAEEWSQ